MSEEGENGREGKSREIGDLICWKREGMGKKGFWVSGVYKD